MEKLKILQNSFSSFLRSTRRNSGKPKKKLLEGFEKNAFLEKKKCQEILWRNSKGNFWGKIQKYSLQISKGTRRKYLVKKLWEEFVENILKHFCDLFREIPLDILEYIPRSKELLKKFSKFFNQPNNKFHQKILHRHWICYNGAIIKYNYILPAVHIRTFTFFFRKSLRFLLENNSRLKVFK